MILIIFNFKKNYNETLFENFILKNIIYFLKNVLNSFFFKHFLFLKRFLTMQMHLEKNNIFNRSNQIGIINYNFS